MKRYIKYYMYNDYNYIHILEANTNLRTYKWIIQNNIYRPSSKSKYISLGDAKEITKEELENYLLEIL